MTHQRSVLVGASSSPAPRPEGPQEELPVLGTRGLGQGGGSASAARLQPRWGSGLGTEPPPGPHAAPPRPCRQTRRGVAGPLVEHGLTLLPGNTRSHPASRRVHRTTEPRSLPLSRAEDPCTRTCRSPRGSDRPRGLRQPSRPAWTQPLGPPTEGPPRRGALTGPLKDRNSWRTTSSEKGGCRATRLTKRFSALRRASMNSLSAGDRRRGHPRGRAGHAAPPPPPSSPRSAACPGHGRGGARGTRFSLAKRGLPASQAPSEGLWGPRVPGGTASPSCGPGSLRGWPPGEDGQDLSTTGAAPPPTPRPQAGPAVPPSILLGGRAGTMRYGNFCSSSSWKTAKSLYRLHTQDWKRCKAKAPLSDVTPARPTPPRGPGSSDARSPSSVTGRPSPKESRPLSADAGAARL